MLIKKKKTEVYALGRYISISADKARRIIDQIRGRSYEETLMILELMPYKGCYPVFKLVYSAAANASLNMGSDKANLVISKAEVNEGTTAKKFKPGARGRSYGIKKATCHITIVVKDISLDEYEDISFYSLKKPRSKKTTVIYHDVYNSEVVWDKK
uniref:Large ribosomal subunit protein uL22c n=2 Tax=Caryopteris TaxID=41385 RepID=A0A6G6A7D1_9LAMI|nr:ribosomal protein L22 [Caryopteris incana]YP_010599947.1 ribosomal protein L22 [Caryopteris tangutica]QID04196.1 ribosomal protein L22 [Caryopteris incana]UDY71947.1 ribosomal protein L22 [Caryopteris tangutica]WAL04480.1 ribosomal protein L22 [Caryopteris tangutica]